MSSHSDNGGDSEDRSLPGTRAHCGHGAVCCGLQKGCRGQWPRRRPGCRPALTESTPAEPSRRRAGGAGDCRGRGLGRGVGTPAGSILGQGLRVRIRLGVREHQRWQPQSNCGTVSGWYCGERDCVPSAQEGKGLVRGLGERRPQAALPQAGLLSRTGAQRPAVGWLPLTGQPRRPRRCAALPPPAVQHALFPSLVPLSLFCCQWPNPPSRPCCWVLSDGFPGGLSWLE